jgi:3-polyprenyl-4-hydroxybenzoate decarboxylase
MSFSFLFFLCIYVNFLSHLTGRYLTTAANSSAQPTLTDKPTLASSSSSSDSKGAEEKEEDEKKEAKVEVKKAGGGCAGCNKSSSSSPSSGSQSTAVVPCTLIVIFAIMRQLDKNLKSRAQFKTS